MKKIIVGTGLFLGGVATGATLLKKGWISMLNNKDYVKRKIYPDVKKTLAYHFGEEKANRIIEIVEED